MYYLITGCIPKVLKICEYNQDSFVKKYCSSFTMTNQLYLYDIVKKVNISVPATETVIGRDSFLQCDDKRISRHHGTIQQNGEEDGSIRIKSTHSNPIFIETDDKVLNILSKDLTATLRHGEKFGLLPDQHWYEVRFDAGSEQETAVSSSSSGSLRVRSMEEVNSAVTTGDATVLPDLTGGAGEKRKQTDEHEAGNSKKSRNESSTEASSVEQVVSPPENEVEAASSAPVPTAVKVDPDASEASSSGQNVCSSDADKKPIVVKQETADSTGSPPRPSCEYGIRCYRHNVEHRAQFAHPNDSDYRRPTFAPAPDDAPHCPYGQSCYRRNPQHFREYQHPDSSEYKASLNPPYRVPVVPNAGQPQADNARADQQRHNRRRRNRQLARDLVIATIASRNLLDLTDDELDEDPWFDAESDSDDYLPDEDEADSEADISTQEFGDNENEE